MLFRSNTIGTATRFVAGCVPRNGQKFKVGDERVDKDGYTWVKVCESSGDSRAGVRRGRRCWRLKHHLVWERIHGMPVPENHAVMFANRDRADFDPGNLVAVPLNVLSTMGVMRMQYYDAATLEACMTLARMRMALKSKKKQIKERK